MELYQCIKQPKGFDENFERRIFKKLYTEYVWLTSNPPQEKTYIKLYCDDTNLNIRIEEEEFNNCFVKFEQPILLRTGGIGIPTVEIIEEKKEMNKQYESEDKMVSHPDHYQSSNGVECIDAIKAATENLTGIFATDTGNIIKYSWRWDDKGTPIRDIEKIIWYATHLLNEVKARENQPKQKKSYVKPEMEIKHASYEDLEEMFKQSI